MSWFGLASTSAPAASYGVDELDALVRVRPPNEVDGRAHDVLDLHDAGAPRCSRAAKSSSARTISLISSPVSRISSSRWCAREPSSDSLRRNSVRPRIANSGLLISCATPAASSPIAVSFPLCTSCWSSCRRSVKSVMTPRSSSSATPCDATSTVSDRPSLQRYVPRHDGARLEPDASRPRRCSTTGTEASLPTISSRSCPVRSANAGSPPARGGRCPADEERDRQRVEQRIELIGVEAGRGDRKDRKRPHLPGRVVRHVTGSAASPKTGILRLDL